MSNYKKRRKQARKEFQEKRRKENFWKSNLIPYKSEEDMSSFKFMWLDFSEWSAEKKFNSEISFGTP